MSARLTDPITLGTLQLRNRLYRAPVLEGAGQTRDPAATYAQHFVPNVAAGLGLVIQGNTIVLPEGRTSPGMSAIGERERMLSLSKLTRGVHEAGGKIVIQLGHAAAVELAHARLAAHGPTDMSESAARFDRLGLGVGERQVWLGNAAQTLHPVAGQGFNLALRDIWELATTLGDADDPGAPELLATYARGRVADRNGAIAFTDLLIHGFGNEIGPLRTLRGAGLLAMDMLPPLRGFVARRMIFGARAWP